MMRPELIYTMGAGVTIVTVVCIVCCCWLCVLREKRCMASQTQAVQAVEMYEAGGGAIAAALVSIMEISAAVQGLYKVAREQQDSSKQFNDKLS